VAPRKLKPHTKIAGKRVPKPKTSLELALDVATALTALRRLAPHLLAETPLIGIGHADPTKIFALDGKLPDMVNHPPHYLGTNGVECLDAQEGALGTEDFISHLRATILGYAWRCTRKGDALEDAKKIQFYANHLVKTLEK
jgi:Protein of unknwon function (DUF3310)